MKNVYLVTLLVFGCQGKFISLEENYSCPENCVCQNQFKNIACSNIAYEKIIDQIPSNLTQITFDNVPIKRDLNEKIALSEELAVLTWRNSNIRVVSHYSIGENKKLERLDLSHNQINFLPENVFNDNLNLKYLNLSHNEIIKLGANVLENLDKLEELYVHNNRLHLSERDQVFNSQWMLSRLDLSHNEINSVENYFFYPNKRLTYLNLRNNKIEKLADHAFGNIDNLRHLDLSNNLLEAVPTSVFQNLKQLEYLNISRNQLSSVINQTLSNLVNLKYLDVSHNPISFISDALFLTNNKLELLVLAHTRLELVKTELLAPLTNLVEISLNSNPLLTLIENEVFYGKASLTNVDISSNALSKLPHSLSVLNISRLNVGNNPWQCDCQMAWFAEWYFQHRVHILPHKSELRCTKTIYPDLVNTPLISTLRGLNCTSAEIVYSTTKRYYFLSENITLTCTVRGEPTPTITWLTPQGWTFHWVPEDSVTPIFKHHPVVHDVHLKPVLQSRIYLLRNGSLLITNFDRPDRGNYSCFVSNAMSNSTALISVQLDPIIVYRGKMLSIAFGATCAFVFLMLTIITKPLFRLCARRCGTDSQARQIQNVRDNIEQYRLQQLAKLQENYALQVSKIKENYVQQMEKLRESYKDQVENLRTIKRNGTTHLVSLREQYCEQVSWVRDYSTGQLNWVRENYVFQRNRIRKFSAHQLVKIRENYKYQQQVLTKVLENLPTLENCKNSCGQSMSTVYDEETATARNEPATSGIGFTNNIQLDSVDSESRLSLYFTPTEHSLSPKSPVSGVSSQPLTKIHGKVVKDTSLDKIKLNSSVVDLSQTNLSDNNTELINLLTSERHIMNAEVELPDKHQTAEVAI